METTKNDVVETKDIFDKIMRLPVLKLLWPFYIKNKDALLYLFFGGCTTLVNLGISAFLWYGLGWEDIHCQTPFGDLAIGTLGGNIISIIAAIIFAYITNKIFVFSSKTNGMKEMMAEFARFIGGRLSTMIIEVGGVQLFVVLFPGSSTLLFVGKLITQILVIVINYFISKFLVFRKPKEEAEESM